MTDSRTPHYNCGLRVLILHSSYPRRLIIATSITRANTLAQSLFLPIYLLLSLLEIRQSINILDKIRPVEDNRFLSEEDPFTWGYSRFSPYSIDGFSAYSAPTQLGNITPQENFRFLSSIVTPSSSYLYISKARSTIQKPRSISIQPSPSEPRH